jgi:Trypsin-co-occurring domain 1
LVSRVVEVPLAEGGSILVEVDEVVDGPVVRGHPAASLPPLAQSLEQVLANLGPATRALVSQMRELTESPHEIEIEFAVKLSADARIVIARAGGEANFRILLKWRHPPDASPPSGHER